MVFPQMSMLYYGFPYTWRGAFVLERVLYALRWHKELFVPTADRMNSSDARDGMYIPAYLSNSMPVDARAP